MGSAVEAIEAVNVDDDADGVSEGLDAPRFCTALGIGPREGELITKEGGAGDLKPEFDCE